LVLVLVIVNAALAGTDLARPSRRCMRRSSLSYHRSRHHDRVTRPWSLRGNPPRDDTPAG
jgi:hypothetical protein